MKGDVGMASHEKERNKKMPSARHKLIPIPTSLFCFKILFVCCECIRQRKKPSHRIGYMKFIVVLKETKMYIGMGL